MMRQCVIVFCFFLLAAREGAAQLSSNPWVEANDAEDVKEVYQKRDKRYKGGVQAYEAEGHTVIDRSHAYIDASELEDDGGDDGVLSKVSGLFSSPSDKEGKVILNTTANRQKIAAKKMAKKEAAHEDSGGFGFSGLKNIGGISKGLSLPKFNATGMIKKFEKASGIDLKAIGQKFK